jgi:hypothetical protein
MGVEWVLAAEIGETLGDSGFGCGQCTSLTCCEEAEIRYFGAGGGRLQRLVF